MKRSIQYFGMMILLFAGAKLNAQGYDNINNRYGPPTYTGGTVVSGSERFALYQQVKVNARAIHPLTAAITEMYPNPAQTYTRITLGESTTERVTVSFINMNGAIIQRSEYPVGTSVFHIDVSSLSDGIYAVQVQEKGKKVQSIQLAKSQ